MSSTATTAAARAHARAQEAAATATARPFVPASTWPHPRTGAAAATAEPLVWAEALATGTATGAVLAAGTTVQLTDVDGGACAHVVLLRADAPWERLNVADTVKVLWQAYLTTGHVLLSDQGRALASVVEDTSGRHDALCGASAAGLFTTTAAKHGLDARDVPPALTFFQGVRVAADGTLGDPVNAGAGRSVSLLLELPAVVLVANSPHPLQPAGAPGGPLHVIAWPGRPTRPEDGRWTSGPEARRAYENTRADRLARGTA
ncbi:urea carboxylase-associated family protein [Kineococcus sp. NUM-3379]